MHAVSPSVCPNQRHATPELGSPRMLHFRAAPRPGIVTLPTSALPSGSWPWDLNGASFRGGRGEPQLWLARGPLASSASAYVFPLWAGSVDCVWGMGPGEGRGISQLRREMGGRHSIGGCPSPFMSAFRPLYLGLGQPHWVESLFWVTVALE